jgi:predicted acyltransferase
MADSAPSPSRLASLDQFRGYTVLGMFLVNFVGSYTAIRAVWPILGHHHTYCSYADTIMPQFFFAVGFAYRLTFLRRVESGKSGSAYWHAIKRNLALFVVAFVVHSVGSRWESWSNEEQMRAVLLRWAKQDLFQTLSHIALTSLWVLPVIAARPSVRVLFAIGSGLLHFGLSYWFNYRWANTSPNGVDGGPLGFLTWTIPLLAGSLAFDAWRSSTGGVHAARRLISWGLVIMALGYGLSCLHLPPSDMDGGKPDLTVRVVEPPLVHIDKKPPTNDLFTMSQRSGSLTYLVFGAGFSLAVYAIFVLASDVGRIQIGIFRTLGTNALAGYIIHGLVNDAVKPFGPRDSPLWYVLTGFFVSLAICYLFLRSMEKQRLFLKL